MTGLNTQQLLPISTPPSRPSMSFLQQPQGITSLTVADASAMRPPPTSNMQRPPARWKAIEFKLYYLVACVVIPIMFWIPISLSFASHPNYPFYKSRLSNGWLFGRKVDNSDAQYRSFRSNLAPLSIAAGLYLFAKFIRTLTQKTPIVDHLFLVPITVFLSAILILALHGANALKILMILVVNYVLAKLCRGSKMGPVLTWLFNGAVLYANEMYSGYRFGSIMPSLEVLDQYSGMYPRWHIIFNITMLRLVSFSMDYYWACNRTHTDDETTETFQATDKQRQSVSHPEPVYSFINYICYVLYPPLYIAGPIITFNDFMWQHRRPLNITRKATISYFVRFIISFLTMEFVLHFMYVVAIKDKKAWLSDTPAQISMIGFWNLVIVWLKLLLPWRFFRLWALMDGISPPENMVRCVANNYSTFGFWRSWHRSYNLWIIRYIYIPLGGSGNVMLNTVFVFSFVALWHDLTFRLLAWGWLVSLFIAPELLARYILPASKYGKKDWYRHVCAIGAVLNILMMMTANLVGFVIGIDGIKFFIAQLLRSAEGVLFLSGAFACLFVGVQLMFEYRAEELRNGIYRRC